jgi:hypothetical protein
MASAFVAAKEARGAAGAAAPCTKESSTTLRHALAAAKRLRKRLEAFLLGECGAEGVREELRSVGAPPAGGGREVGWLVGQGCDALEAARGGKDVRSVVSHDVECLR